MKKQRLKLKQASAVLQIEPKELQNLVQFGVVKHKRFEGTYFCDTNTLFGSQSGVLSEGVVRDAHECFVQADGRISCIGKGVQVRQSELHRLWMSAFSR